MNNSVYEQIFRTQSVSDDVLCLELRTRKPSTSWSDKLGVSASAVFVEEWSSGKYPESATPIGESVSCCVAFVHSNSLCLLLNFSVLCFFYKLLNRTPWGQRKTMIRSRKVKRKNTNIMIDVKKEIIAKHENGVRVSDLATQFGMAKSTICTILKTERQSRKPMLQEEWQLLLNKDHRRLKKKLRTFAQSTVVKV